MSETVLRPEVSPYSAKHVARRLFRHENALLAIALAALISGLSIVTGGLTVGRTNMVNILIQSSMRGLASVGQAFVVLSGGIDVSVGGVANFCAALGAALMTLRPEQSIVNSPLPVFLAILIMLVGGAAWGAVNGSSVSRIGMPPLIVTLAMWQITVGVAVVILKGGMIHTLPEGLLFWGQGMIGPVPMPIIIFVVVAVLAYIILNHTTFGRWIYAVGGNETSAWLSGIEVRRVRFLVYIIAGFLSAIAAMISLGRVMSASIASLSGLEMDSIAAVTIGGFSLTGGRGNMIGVVLGVLIIGVVNNGMSVIGADPALQGIVKGAIIFAAVAVDGLRR